MILLYFLCRLFASRVRSGAALRRSAFLCVRLRSIPIICRIAFIIPSERNQPPSMSNHQSAAPFASQKTKSRYIRLRDSASFRQAVSAPGKIREL